MTVPSAVADFPNEGTRSPRILLESRYPNLLQYTTLPRGGHFAALEEPRLLADDFLSFVEKLERSYND